MVVNDENRLAVAMWIYDSLDRNIRELLNVKDFNDSNKFVNALIKGLIEAAELDAFFVED